MELVVGPATPFLKWVGGKSRLLPQLRPLLPAGEWPGYIEPFLGGGAMFYDVRGAVGRNGRVVLSDVSGDLMMTYLAVKDDLKALTEALWVHAKLHSKDYYYEVRAQDPRDVVGRAARFIYLNKTCFNGLYRVNSRGQFNVPMGKYENPPILDRYLLAAASEALQGVSLTCGSYQRAIEDAEPGEFIYMDPPYAPVKADSFVSYTADKFGEDQQRELAARYRDLAERGCKVMLSNSDVPFIRELYQGFRIVTVKARRNINRDKNGRGPVDEIVVLSYE